MSRRREHAAVIAGAPRGAVPAPKAIAVIAGNSSVRPVWRNELGGLTFEITDSQGRRFVKWAPAGSGLDLAGETTRLRWAADYISVPRVLDTGADAEGSWMVTAGLPGDSAVARRWLADAGTAVVAIGRGLRLMHDRLPVGACPFSWDAGDRASLAQA